MTIVRIFTYQWYILYIISSWIVYYWRFQDYYGIIQQSKAGEDKVLKNIYFAKITSKANLPKISGWKEI